MKDYTPNELLIDRVCELWVRMLREPKYDNGDRSLAGFMCQCLAQQAPVSGADVLETFRTELKARLTVPFTYPPYRNGGDAHTNWVHSLSVDYDPDYVLQAAAEAAGLKTKFPWKSTVHFYGDEVSVSAGYGAAAIYHYPLEDGDWLVTSLRGGVADTKALVDFAKSGERAAFFDVEYAKP